MTTITKTDIENKLGKIIDNMDLHYTQKLKVLNELTSDSKFIAGLLLDFHEVGSRLNHGFDTDIF